MKPSSIIAIILAVSSFSTAAMLFWDGPTKLTSKTSTRPNSVEIKWGEGSEADAPDSTSRK